MGGKTRVLCLVGETATGKTRLAIELAEAFDGEIINADSMQVYRGMDIATAKPTGEEQARVPFHLIDVCDPNETFSAGRFRKLARRAIADITARGRLPIVAGGTGLYIKTLIHGLIDTPPVDRLLRERLRKTEAGEPGALHRRVRRIDPATAARLSPKDHVRLIRALEVFEATGRTLSEMQKEHGFALQEFDAMKLGIRREAKEMSERIEERVRAMIEEGLAEEVRRLLLLRLPPGSPALSAVGISEMTRHIKGEMSLEEAADAIIRETKRLAKRQRTWFRADEDIRWFTLPGEKARLFDLVTGWAPGRGAEKVRPWTFSSRKLKKRGF